MLKQTSEEVWLDIRKPGLGGLNTIADPSEVGDNDCTDIINMVFDSGVASPRRGSVLWASKPSAETQDPLQTMVPGTSDGLKYVIVIYGNNFYLRDETNDRWIKLNHTYTPVETTLYYGNISWNNGRGDDRQYFCNGVDNFARWNICLDFLASNHSAAATTVTLVDASRFASSGTLVVNDGSTEITATYVSKSGNVLTLSGTLGTAMTSGSSVTVEMVEKSGMEKAKIINRWQRRLVVANRYGGETNFYYSVVDDPEDFTVGGNTADGGFFQLSDGNGGLTGLHDFGTYLLLEKRDSLTQFSFQLNPDLDSKLDKVEPLISGFSMGPLNPESSIKVLNSLYYPTDSNGITVLNPRVTGSQASTLVEHISAKIFTYVNGLNFDTARVAFADQKVFWACATSSINNLVLMYDLIRQAWTKFDSWPAKDVFSKDDEFYYLSRINGNIYKGLTGQNDADVPYLASFSTKRYNFGRPSMPKTADAVYIEGYMTDATEFFVDVIYNELGRLGKITFTINDDTEGLYFAPVNLDALGQFPMELIPLGIIPDSQVGTVGIFRGYLSIPNRLAFYNLQLRFYSISANSLWSLTGYAVNPNMELAISPLMRIDGVIGDTPVQEVTFLAEQGGIILSP